MRRVKRLGLYVGIPLLLFVCVVIGIRAFLPHTDLLKQSIEAALEKATEQKVTLGKVHLAHSFSRLIDVTLEDLVITGADGSTLTTIRRVSLQPSLISLLRLHVTISAITVEGLNSTISLESDGSAPALFLPIPFSGQSGPAASRSEPQEATPVVSHEEKKPDSEPRIASTITWEVGLVRILEGRINIIGAQGTDPLVTISRFSGDIKKVSGENAYSYHLEVALQTGSENRGTFKASGMLKGDEDWSRLDAASVDISGEAVDLGLIGVFIPNTFLLSGGSQARKCDVKVVFARGKPVRASMDTVLAHKDKGIGRIGVQAEITTDDALKTVEAVTGQGRIDRFPLALLAESIRKEFPLKFDTGYASATIDWSWGKTGWKTFGNLALDEAVVSTEKFSPDPVSVVADFEMDPQLLLLKKVNFRQSNEALSLSGQVSGPLSESPSLDFVWQGTISDRALQPFLASHVEAAGRFPVKGTLRGPIQGLSLDAAANLEDLSFGISRFVQKRRETAGNLALSARIRPHGESGVSKAQVDGSLSFRLANVQIGLQEQDSLIPKARIEFETKIAAGLGRIDMKDASLDVFGLEKSQKILSASGTVTAIGSAQEKLGIQIKTTVDRPIFNNLSRAFSMPLDLDGKTELVFRISGSRDVFDWSINAPLSGIGIRIGDGFSKPVGTSGSMKAAGTWNKGELTLAKGELSTTGIALMASGRLRDRKGSFHDLNVDIKKMDLADVSKLMSLKDFRISGQAEGQFRLGNSGQGLVPTGAVNLANATLSPHQQAGFMLSNINGVVEIKGQTVRSDDLSGRLKGVMDAPVKMRGTLSNLESLDTVQGTVSIQTGKGTLKGDFLTSMISQTQQVIGRALAAGGLANGERVFQVEGGSASLKIGGGFISSQDLKIKGSAVALGAVGSYKLAENSLNSTVSVQTRLFENMPLGKLPGVQQVLKQNEGWLKATGLDKELRKFGISPPENQSGESPKTPDEKIPPTTILFKVQGSVRNPKFIPVLESSLDKKTVELLKDLSQL